MYLLKSSKGMSLLSLLISLAVLVFITPFIVHFLNFIITISSPYNQADLEIRHIHFYIQSEMNQSIDQRIEDQAITFINTDGSTVTIELYKNLLRRRVNNTGHEIILRDVNEFKINTVSENIFTIYISKGDHSKFEKTYFKQKYD